MHTFLQESGVPYWVSFGTLLGFYREGGLISHDVDVDFSCDEAHYELLWDRRYLLPKGMKMTDSSSRHYGPKLYVTYRGYDADIYFYRHQDKMLHPFEKTDWQNYRNPIPEALVYPLKPFRITKPAGIALSLGARDSNSAENDGLMEIETMVPADIEGYLRFIYGSLEPDAVRNKETGFWE
jgi:hypothetical protein